MAIWAKDKKQQRAIAAAQAAEQAKQEHAQRYKDDFILHGKWPASAYGRCMFCPKTFEPHVAFESDMDDVMWREYKISLVCPACQKTVFAPLTQSTTPDEKVG